MKSHLEYWHNGFAAHAMQAIEALVCENGQTLTNKELVAEEIAMHLDDAELLVMADYTYRTFAYQWATWSKDKENRKVCMTLFSLQIFSIISSGFWSNPACPLHVCKRPSCPPRGH